MQGTFNDKHASKKKGPNPAILFTVAVIIAGLAIWQREAIKTKIAELQYPPQPNVINPAIEDTDINPPLVVNGAQLEFAAPSPSMTASPTETATPTGTPEEDEPIDFVITVEEIAQQLGKPGEDSDPKQDLWFSVKHPEYNPEILQEILQAVCSGGNVIIDGLTRPIFISIFDAPPGMGLSDIKCSTGSLLTANTNFVMTVTQTTGVNIPGTFGQVPASNTKDLIENSFKSFEGGGSGLSPSLASSSGLSQFRFLIGGFDAVVDHVSTISAIEGENGVKWPYPQILKQGGGNNQFTIKEGTLKTITIWPLVKNTPDYLKMKQNYAWLLGIPVDSPRVVTEITAFRFLADKAMIEKLYMMQNR